MKFPTLFFLAVLIATLLVNCTPTDQQDTVMEKPATALDKPLSLYLGTYTRKEGHVDGKAAGIYHAVFNPETGSVTVKDSTAGIVNPSFVKSSRDGALLYAVSETGEGEIFAYTIGEEHGLTLVNKRPTGAPAPCHIAVDQTDKYVIVSNYMGGIVNIYERGTGGELSEIQRLELNAEGDEKQSHAHSATFSPDNQAVFIMDLGKDRIWSYRFDEKTGKLTPAATPFQSANAAGAGPRHFTFTPNGKFAFAINELNNTLTSYAYRAESGELTQLMTQSTLPTNYEGGNSCADVHVHPSGKFVYGSNRGHNSIVCFSVADDGQFSLVGHTPTGGDFPRNFALSPAGDYLLVANQNSNNLLSFKVDEETGQLTQASDNRVMTPVCINFIGQ